MNDYLKFIETKIKSKQDSGFEPHNLNPNLFDFQKYIVEKACKIGRYAIFADCGLGKTLMQLSWASQVVKHTNKPVLVLVPLAVAQQTIEEGMKFSIEVYKYVVGDSSYNPTIYITNYEQLSNIDTSIFGGVVLDESSILKNFTGKTKQAIIDAFENTPYKLACTATPSPNDPMEMCNHAEFLNAMGRNEMLAKYFVHDGGNTSKWRLKGHAREAFYSFISSWATMVSNPCDLGFNGTKYNLPKLEFIDHQIKTESRNNGALFNDIAVSATNFNKELKATMDGRMKLAAEIANSTNEPVIVWIKRNDEGDILRKLIPDAVEVKGSDKPHIKENRLLGFAKGDFRVLITKAKIAQFGLNYQHCKTQVFASLDFSFEGLYQAVRRSYRFGQNNDVNIHLITTDTMQNVVSSIHRKQKQFNEMKQEMNKTMNKSKEMTIGEFDIEEEKNEYYNIKRGDCVELIKEVPDNSVGFSIFSPPFAELYTYSSHVEDMGNSKDYQEFLTQFQFLVKELYRVIESGRNVAIHCMDLPIQKGKEGYIGLRDFSGMILDAFHKEGFIYHSRVTIWKDPVVEMQRTKALGLLHKQVKKDSTMSRVGIPDYLMVFRKDGERNNPVTNTELPVDLWQKYASPVWYDINYSDTLQYRSARTERDEKHICPLQLPTIERAIHLWTNIGDSVLTPFMGIGSEVFQAVKMGRYGIGFELKESYFQLAKNNIESAVQEKAQTSLF
ncbi:DNA methylase [Candidatus Bathyarchaeota archaeon]|nr:MAG: DNA methylase [Candidatus Bathyarchaeota archaeon]